jgi:hypothetical protein
MSAFLFTTSSPHFSLVAVGDDEEEARNRAASLLSAPLVIRDVFPVGFAAIIANEITVINPKKSDDVLIARLLKDFEGRAKVELRNSFDDPAKLQKRFYLNERLAVDLDFDKTSLADYEKTGLTEACYRELVSELEKQLATRSPKLTSASETEAKPETEPEG